MHRISEYGRSHDYFATRGPICVTVKSVLEKVALRRLSDASYAPRKKRKSTTYGSVILRRSISDYKVKNVMN